MRKLNAKQAEMKEIIINQELNETEVEKKKKGNRKAVI